MRKNKLLMIFLILNTILLFATSTIFYGCSKQATVITEIKEGEKKISAEKGEEKALEEKETRTSASKDIKEANSNKTGELETDKNMKVLYHITKHHISKLKYNDTECFALNFVCFLDGGIINQDGSNNKILNLKDYPTCMVTSKKYNNFYYISSTVNPVSEFKGFFLFDWDVDDQTLWEAQFSNNDVKKIKETDQTKFPGDVLPSPDNEYLIYLLTEKGEEVKEGESFISGKINPFISDTDLIVRNTGSGEEKTVLKGSYNRQLCTSFSDFSTDGKYFYTISRQQDKFEFIRVTLKTGAVQKFREIFPQFDWDTINWDDFLPKTGDMNYGSFSISPDETRLIGYKSIVSVSMDNPCYGGSSYKLWVFNIEENKTKKFENQEGYVADSSWNSNSKEFALAIVINGGCYPDYLDAKILKFDRDGEVTAELVFEPKSKITNIGWSPVENIIAYDVYSTDLIGCIKLVNTNNKEITELINTNNDLKIEIDSSEPVLLLFADWVK
jgi:cell division protein FtsL